MMSCNAYYCYVLREILENRKYGSIDEAMDKWNEYVKSFGFGQKLGSDFPSELGGNIPDSKYYNRVESCNLVVVTVEYALEWCCIFNN